MKSKKEKVPSAWAQARAGVIDQFVRACYIAGVGNGYRTVVIQIKPVTAVRVYTPLGVYDGVAVCWYRDKWDDAYGRDLAFRRAASAYWHGLTMDREAFDCAIDRIGVGAWVKGAVDVH